MLLFHTDVAQAQFLDQGGVTGTVTDPSGAVIPNAKVALKNIDTGLILRTVTNGAGIYVFSPVKIGHYEITASAKGFQTTTQEHLTVQIQERLNVSIKLQPGEVSQTVTVTTAPPLLQTQEGSVGQVMTTREINHTPLNGRNWVFMVQLSPGAVTANGRGKQSGDFSANGLRPEQNNFVLGGMENNAVSMDYLGGQSFLINPPPDALSQFKVSTADYSAEFGHSAGAVVDAAIKSGTNQIHGDLWEYWRNDVLDAKDFNALSVPEFRENLFGATLGLPILKNHLFFFGDVQANRIVAGQPFTQSVPTALERQGNFTELLNPSLTGSSRPITLYEPNSGGNTRMTCDGQQNVLCPNQIDPVALKILNMYPLPNANGGKTFANDVLNLRHPQNTFQWDARVDWDISSDDQAFVRFSYTNQLGDNEAPLGPVLDGGGGDGSANLSGNQVVYGNALVFSETHTFTPSLVNEFRFGYNYAHFDVISPNATVNISPTLGLKGVPFGGDFPMNGGVPMVSISSIANFGTRDYRPEIEFENEYQVLDNVSETMGKHSLKLGISLQSLRSSTFEPPASHGEYNYTGFFTSANGAAFTGNGIADYLADQMHSANISPSSAFNNIQWVISGYAQDDWRLLSNLTLNLGLRYDWFEPYREMSNRQASFYPTAAPGVSTGAATLSYPVQQRGKLPLSAAFIHNLTTDHISIVYSQRPGLTNEQVLNFSPRIGFAYSVNPVTVLHGGFGIFYQGQQQSGAGPALGDSYPFEFTDSFPSPTCDPQNPPCAADGFTLENGLKSVVDQGLSNFAANPSMNGQSPDLKTTYAMDYNFTAQRALTPSVVATLAYVGDVSRHVPVEENPNSSTVVAAPGVNMQPLLPFPSFGGVGDIDYVGISSYNSLQAKIQKRMANGLDFLATYVWSHALTDAQSPLGDSDLNYRDVNIIPIRDEYTNAGWDTRQRFTFNGFYEIPVGSGTSHQFRSKVLNETLGGWASSLTFQMQTGQPFSVGVANIATVSGAGTHAILVGDPFAPGGSPNATNPSITCPAKVRTLQHWYNPCAFANPEPGTRIAKGQLVGGSAALPFLGGRSNTVYGPGFNRLDLSVFKNFRTYREQHFQFRVDAFNLLNIPDYGDPSTANDGQNGGLITAARIIQSFTPDARFFQLSAKYVF